MLSNKLTAISGEWFKELQLLSLFVGLIMD